MKNAILQFDQSRIPEGLTQSRYPSNEKQIIPPFSLFWIAMLHDYRQIGSDTAFVRPLLPGVTAVLNWHRQYVGGQQLLVKMPYWNFVDWPSAWPWTGKEETSGIPPGTLEGKSSILTLQYVYALKLSADLYRGYGYTKEALAAETEAARIGKAVYQLCWDKDRKRLADTPDKNVFSQHANILAALTDIGPNEYNFLDNRELLINIENDSSLIPCTLYYRFYLARALQQLQAGERYLGLLKDWYNMLDLGLTTFAERPEPTRSDCHAWSASPLYDLLATVAGITPASSGFNSVRIAPELAGLDWLDVAMPHPKGEIKLKLEKKDGRLKGNAILPRGVSGRFYWNEKILDLQGGTNRIDIL
ncbi:hypothetical protein MKQ70_01680 [Chitinophaga sedimenti]|uniref:alpha-L-rhamnosidase C-terminal domain-containing protein n=1 Tax=Chitinophaga sedimenti TaxID=2033606 RepID=UPI002006ACAF|nr:alpha-L-rhamnosidase C-terminal domain-containing protein [Chitinophaga sedimenti]MCK7553781.1 hypothetical protein [Chitinophaga sedimenti]